MGPTAAVLTGQLLQEHVQLAPLGTSVQPVFEKMQQPAVIKKNTVSVVVAGLTHRLEHQNVVNAALQRATSPRKSELDWEPASGIVQLKFTQGAASPDLGTWAGELDLPADFQPGSFRMDISELRRFVIDKLDATGRAQSATGMPLPARAVYADTIEI